MGDGGGEQMDPEGQLQKSNGAGEHMDPEGQLQKLINQLWSHHASIERVLNLPPNSTHQILLLKSLVPFDQRNNINTDK